MSESASKRQRRPAAGGEEHGNEDAMVDADGQQQQQATASHSIDLEAFAHHFGQIPVVVAYVFSFVSLHLVAALPQRLWRHVGCQITQLVMDTHDAAERRFWCGLSFAEAFEWGRRLTRLKSIVVRYPNGLRVAYAPLAERVSQWLERMLVDILVRRAPDYRTLPRVIDKIVTALVEGHSDAPRATAAAAGQTEPAGGTLESIEYSNGGSIIVVDEAEGREIRAAEQLATALPPPLDPPLTLTSLTSVTGLALNEVYPGRGRHWQLPSLETVQTVDCEEVLGKLVATSRRLKELQVEFTPDVMAMAEELRCVPVAEAGQPGPLSQLEDIGTLSMLSRSAEGLERLQAVLVDRGCRSIKKFSAQLRDWYTDSRIFETLQTIEAFTRTVCESLEILDISINIEDFDLSLLCDVPTRPEPSPFVQKHIQQGAAKALSASFGIRPHHLTTPLDTPSRAAIALARSLTFPEATSVRVVDHLEFAEEEVQPDPIVLDSIPDNAFPAASSLEVFPPGLAIARRLVTKMPAVKRIDLWWTHPTEAEAVGVLQAVGGDRHLEHFEARRVKGVGEGGLTWGDIADQLPTIAKVNISIEVPEELGDGDAAGEFGIACVKSLLKIRGIKQLTFRQKPFDAFARLIEDRTHGDTIEGLEGRYDIGWGRDDDFTTTVVQSLWNALTGKRDILVLKPLDT
ncbi:unnamed protein product [Vitrella brassicaformis CCMP3155]|uniref:Uncharacterized protein n=1 Tax=Vitrella brassicaformis (strain CCMP3155) TaxID=1169540 RepID=A0A0G4H6Q7_VITBC|nr:unnamed protein product [Vitrella brassicaformis CCMP3155]|eukprot:CEM39365.1 unnamed protein product [Vitrella brassicaformis CCMP3155]